jgi:hypothetical protein
MSNLSASDDHTQAELEFLRKGVVQVDHTSVAVYSFPRCNSRRYAHQPHPHQHPSLQVFRRASLSIVELTLIKDNINLVNGVSAFKGKGTKSVQ